jgi:ribosomal protein S18 acetylase RimI-like enzyme
MTHPQIERVSPDADTKVFQACARIHRDEITAGFLSTMGEDFLAQLYRTIARSSSAFLFIARTNHRILGFVCGSQDTKRVYRDFLLHAGLRMVPKLLPTLFSIARVKRVFETLRYPRRRELATLPDAEILNFCVSSDAQGLGIGRALFGKMLVEFKSRGVECIRIVVGESQKTAQRFYAAAGAEQVARVSVHRESPSIVYLYRLPGNGQSPPASDSEL